MNILLLALISLVWIVILARKRWSVLTLATIGMTAYSLPAVVGWSTPVRIGMTETYVPTTPEATFAMFLAWLGLLSSFVWAPRQMKARPRGVDVGTAQSVMYSCLLLSVIGYAIISIVSGPLFFLKPRTEAFEGANLIILWRWLSVFGLLTAIQLRNMFAITYFAAAIGMIFIAGDRTLVFITTFSCLLYFFWNSPLFSRTSIYTMATASPFVFAFILFAKPLYNFIKNPSIPLGTYLEGHIGRDAFFGLGSIEPFGIHYILEAVIANDLKITFGQFITPIVAQLLIVPSVFGVSSQSFNILLTERLFQGVTYGLAFNPWAQAYSLGGYMMVFIFGACFGIFGHSMDRLMPRVRNILFIIVCIASVIVAAYGHRNSIENSLAFIRQVLLVGGLVFITSYVFRQFLLKASAPGISLAASEPRPSSHSR